jgi:hypothetical protein
MTKELVEKILHPKAFFDTGDLSPDEKKRILTVLEKVGFTMPTFYLRFFQKGFSEWEILGVDKCKKQFLELPDVAQSLSEYVDEENSTSVPGDKGYFYVLAHSDTPGVFYFCLKKVNKGLCNKFMDFMNERGMCPATTIKRFSTDDSWKPWEKAGMADILKQFID